MGLFRRIVLLVVSVGLVCGLRKAAPHGPDTWRSEVTAKLNAVREYMEPHVTIVMHELNSFHECVQPHMAKAKVEFDTHLNRIRPVLDKHLAEAKIKAAKAKVIAAEHLAAATVKAGEFSSRSRVTLQEMYASAGPMYEKYSAIARVKAEALSESATQKFDEASAQFSRNAIAAAQTFTEQVGTVVSHTPRDMEDAFKEYYQNLPMAQLRDYLAVAGSALFAVYLILEIFLFVVGLPSRLWSTPMAMPSEQASQSSSSASSSSISVDTVPSVVQQRSRSMNVTRRRRCDSPGVVAPRGQPPQVHEDLGDMQAAQVEGTQGTSYWAFA